MGKTSGEFESYRNSLQSRGREGEKGVLTLLSRPFPLVPPSERGGFHSPAWISAHKPSTFLPGMKGNCVTSASSTQAALGKLRRVHVWASAHSCYQLRNLQMNRLQLLICAL